MRSNPSGHFVFFELSPNASYRVKDESTGVVVATGTAGLTGKRKTIFGLYRKQDKLYVDTIIGGCGYINNN